MRLGRLFYNQLTYLNTFLHITFQKAPINKINLIDNKCLTHNKNT